MTQVRPSSNATATFSSSPRGFLRVLVIRFLKRIGTPRFLSVTVNSPCFIITRESTIHAIPTVQSNLPMSFKRTNGMNINAKVEIIPYINHLV